MTDTDPTPTPSTDLRGAILALFSPGTLAALRYALAAISPAMALFGLTALTPDQIDRVVTYAKTFGAAASAVFMLLGILVPLLMAMVGVLSATVKKQIARVRELATNPQLANEEAQKAIVAATKAIADRGVPKSQAAVQALVDTTISLPQVQTIIASPKVATMSPSPDVIAAPMGIKPAN